VLPENLAAWQIGYRHVQTLGGLRGRRRDEAPSPNAYWDNLSFRNYADYTATAAFRAGFVELRELGRIHPCTIMCAEAVWWRCHRRIITDYLIGDGVDGPRRHRCAKVRVVRTGRKGAARDEHYHDRLGYRQVRFPSSRRG